MALCFGVEALTYGMHVSGHTCVHVTIGGSYGIHAARTPLSVTAFTRARNLVLYDKEFNWEDEDREALDEIQIRSKAMLVLLNIGAYPDLLTDTTAAGRNLENILYTIRHNMLHVRGTLALLLPKPWVVHGGRLHGKPAKPPKPGVLLAQDLAQRQGACRYHQEPLATINVIVSFPQRWF